MNRLQKHPVDKMAAGVLGGFARYFNTDSALLRLGFVLLTLFTGLVPGIVIYLVAAVVMPDQRTVKI